MTQDKSTNLLVTTLGRECIAMRIRLISRAISRIYDEALRPHGMKSSQMSILAVISMLGQADPGEICRSLHLTASTLSRNVTRMRKRGWLDVCATEDRRSHRLTLTPDGCRILKEAFPSWQEAQEKVTSMLGEDDTAAIKRIAGAIRGSALFLPI